MREVKQSFVIILVIFGICALIMSGGAHMSAPGQIAKVEAVRSAVSRVDPTQAEDIYGQAVEANARIKSRQLYNNLWWSGIFVSDRWDDVEEIDIPGRR